MKHYFLNKKNQSKLILFFCGWGNDYHPFLNLDCENNDVLMFYDYRDLKTEINFQELLASYKEVHLISWSLGVFVANHLFQDVPFSSTTAINGTLQAMDDRLGIPVAIFDGTIQLFNERNRDKFFKRMCLHPEAITFFEKNKPERELSEQLEELKILRDLILNHPPQKNIYNRAIIGTEDAIFPPQNMIHYWKGLVTEENLIQLEAPHFLFHLYRQWSDLCPSILKNH